MADSPRLPTTTLPNEYAPYSVTAIAALVVAILFLVLLLSLGIPALVSGQPLDQPMLLVPALATFVLAFAARRQIANSEGTRVGLNLCNIAWWIAVIGGLGFVAYLAGRSFSVRDDARAAFQDWAGNVLAADPLEPRTPEFHKAYVRLMPAARQADVAAKTPKDIETKQNERREDAGTVPGVVRFRQSDLLRVVARNKGAVSLEFAGLEKWEQDPSGLRCAISGLIKSPEGEFNVRMDMIQQLAEGRPVWQIVGNANGFIGGFRLTPYGKLVRDLEVSGMSYTYTALLPIFERTGLQPAILTRLSDKGWDGKVLEDILGNGLARIGAIGGIGWQLPDGPTLDDEVRTKRFVPLPRLDGAKEADLRDQFLSVWKQGRFVRPGIIIRDSPDLGSHMTIGEKSVEIRVPIEMQLPRTESSQSAARGWVVLACDEPGLIGRLNAARTTAGTDGFVKITQDTKTELAPWRFVRVESDMKLIQAPQRMQQR